MGCSHRELFGAHRDFEVISTSSLSRSQHTLPLTFENKNGIVSFFAARCRERIRNEFGLLWPGRWDFLGILCLSSPSLLM